MKKKSQIIEIPDTNDQNLAVQETENIPETTLPSFIMMLVSLDHLNLLLKNSGALCCICEKQSLFYKPTSNVGISTVLTLNCECGHKEGLHIMPKEANFSLGYHIITNGLSLIE